MITSGTFDFVANAHLSQLVPIFAFTMIAVGFAAPGAMSKQDLDLALMSDETVAFATWLPKANGRCTAI